MKNKKIILTNLNNDNQDMITQAKDSNELEAVINLKQKDLLNVVKLSEKDLKSIKYGKDVINYKVEFDKLKDQSLNIKEDSIIIISIVDKKQTNDPEDKKMTNKDISNALNLILTKINSFENELNSFKTEVREEFKNVNSRIDNLESYVKEEFKKVNSRIDNLESYVKEEFEKINTKFDDHMEKYHSKG